MPLPGTHYWGRILFPALILHLSSLMAEPSPGGVVRLDFPNLRTKGDLILSSGRGTLHYGDFTLESDHMEFNRKSGSVKLVGEVLLKGRGVRMTTFFIEGNVKKRVGLTGSLSASYEGQKARSEVEREILIKEKEGGLEDDLLARKIFLKVGYAELRDNEKGEPDLLLFEVSVTDCNHQPPHHDYLISKLRLSVDHRVEAQHFRPRLFGVPYFYLPYIGRDLSRDWPWTRWSFGSSSDWGPWAKVESRPLGGRSREKLKFTLGAMARRGAPVHLDWDDAHEKGRRQVSLFGIAERWSEEEHPQVIEENRFGVDWVERLRLPHDLNLSLDVHYQKERNASLWTGLGNTLVSDDLHANPLVTNKDPSFRDGLLKEYFEERFESGRLPEHRIALSRESDRHHLEIEAYHSADRESLLQHYRPFAISGEVLPSKLGSSSFAFSLDYDLGMQGLTRGPAVTDSDVLSWLGATSSERAETWRAWARPRVETRLFEKTLFKVRPYLGWESLGYGEVLKSGNANLPFYKARKGIETESGVWSHRLQGGVLLGTTFHSPYRGGWKHRLRPSLRAEVQGPSSFDVDRVWVPVDPLDFQAHPRLALRWALASEWWTDKNGARLDQRLEVLHLPREEDRKILFDADLRGGSDIQFDQSYRPKKGVLVFNQFKMSSLVARMELLKAGVHFEGWRHDLKYSFSRIEDLRGRFSATHRHDLNWSWTGEDQWTRLGVSWDSEEDGQASIGNKLYDWGFRRLDLEVQRRIHCLRVGLALEYDFEDSGATAIFQFGPDFLGNYLPGHREGLGN